MSRTRTVSALIVGLVCVATDLAGARAASLDTIGPGAVTEASHRVDVRFAGVVAVVETHQTLLNEGKDTVEARYRFELPADAAITGLEVTLGDGTEARARVVDADNAIAFMPESESTKGSPDLAVLRMTAVDPDADGASARTSYELRIYPVDKGELVRVTMRWAAPLRYEDGRLSLRIPGRGEAPELVRERVTISATAPEGTKGIASINVNGPRDAADDARANKKAATGDGRVSFTAAPTGDIVIDAVPIFASRDREPRASFAIVPIADGVSAMAATVLVPPPGAHDGELGHERVVIAVDVSRSMDTAGLKAAVELTDALLTRTADGARVEVITFDRTVKRVLGAWSKVDAASRKKVSEAIEQAPLANGSDLGAALDELRALVGEGAGDAPAEGFSRGEHASTLVVLISDTMTPLALDGDRALDRVGAGARAATQFLSVVLVPDDAAVPSTVEGPLPALARVTGGRALAVRHGEVATRAATLVGELAQPPSIEMLTVETAGVTLRDAAPPEIAPGSGATLFGLWRGKTTPKTLALSARRGVDEVTITAKRDANLATVAGAMMLATAELTELVPPDAALDPKAVDVIAYDEETLEAAERALVAGAIEVGAVTRESALVALDPDDAFATDRWALYTKWGTFARMPPPPERDSSDAATFGAFQRLTQHAATTLALTPGGTLDPVIIQRVIATDVIGKAKLCYEAALRRDNGLSGSLTLVFEISRGEVQHAAVAGSSFTGAGTLEACVVEAGYNANIPRVASRGNDETIWVIRYPLKFQRDPRGIDQVFPGDADSSDPIDFGALGDDDVESPLGGIKPTGP